MSIKYIITVFSLSVLVGCGGGGSTATAISAVDEIIDQVDTTNEYPESFASLKQELPWGLQDKTGFSTAIQMAIYTSISSQFLGRTPIAPVLRHEPNDDECDFGGNVTSVYNYNDSIEDYSTYSISRDADMCRTNETRYFSGHAELEGITDFRNENLRKDTTKYSTNNFSSSTFIGFIENGTPLKSQLTSVQVYASGSFNQYVENDTTDGRQDDTRHYTEDSPGWIYSVSGLQNTFNVITHSKDSVHKELHVNNSQIDGVKVTTVSKANYSSSWVMVNNAEGNALVMAAGFFAGAGTGVGYEYTFPEGQYHLSVQVLSPIVRTTESSSFFPSEGSILVDLSSHNISAIVTFSGGAQVSITTNGVNVVTNLDKYGQVM